ncbi:MAG: hypothetical protein ABIR03_03000 [Ginsengibacter sp.]
MKKLLLSFVFLFTLLSGWSLSDKLSSGPRDVSPVQVQSGNPFIFFNAHRQGYSSIGLMWRISNSDNIISFQVQRSYDGEFFDLISDLPCNAFTQKFNWKDDNVFPGYIYYRLAANLMDGSIIYSEVQVVHIVQK